MNLLASQIAIAIENARVYESERRNRELLALLYDISLEMGSTLEIDELVHKIAAAVKQKINYHTFSIFFSMRSRLTEAEVRHPIERAGKSEAGSAIRHGSYRNGGEDESSASDRGCHTRSTVLECSYGDPFGTRRPLTSKGRVVGIVDLESTKAGYFTEYHERFLMTLASRIASALVNAELYAQRGRKRKPSGPRDEDRAGDSAAVDARRVPFDSAAQMAVLFKSVAQLGGDLYDWIEFDDGRLAIVIGDVAGKGAPAALYGAFPAG